MAETPEGLPGPELPLFESLEYDGQDCSLPDLTSAELTDYNNDLLQGKISFEA